MSRVLLIQGSPKPGSFCDALGEAYARGAESAATPVRRLVVRDLRFDPYLGGDYQAAARLEADLQTAQEAIWDAQHLVWVYPIWWGFMPAMLKGFIDRTLLPGFAFKYRRGSALWDKLLVGRTARLIVTMDAPPLYNRIAYRNAGPHLMRKAILGFCGVKPVRVTSIGSIKMSSPARRARWLARVERLGAKD